MLTYSNMVMEYDAPRNIKFEIINYMEQIIYYCQTTPRQKNALIYDGWKEPSDNEIKRLHRFRYDRILRKPNDWKIWEFF